MATTSEIVRFYNLRKGKEFLINKNCIVKYRKESVVQFTVETLLVILFDEIKIGLI
tara:strand:+ start:434 stop:601 length:168 start_codon:yes stop_codon:yes gene_type:complete